MFKNKEIFNLAKAYDYLIAYSTMEKQSKNKQLIEEFKLYSDELYKYLCDVDSYKINVFDLTNEDKDKLNYYKNKILHNIDNDYIVEDNFIFDIKTFLN